MDHLPIKGETKDFARVVECCDTCRPGTGVGIVIQTVTKMGSSGRCSHPMKSSGGESFKIRVGPSLDAQDHGNTFVSGSVSQILIYWLKSMISTYLQVDTSLTSRVHSWECSYV